MNTTNNDKPEIGICEVTHPKDTLPKLVSVGYGILGLVFLCLFIKYLNYGFEFTDEGIYLLLMQRPGEYPFAITLAGYFYHPLYVLTGGDIFLMRVGNFLIMFAVAFNLCRLFLKRINPKESNFSPPFFYLSVFQLSLCSTVILLLWLPTPNYNLSNYISMMLVATGVLVLAEEGGAGKTNAILGWLVIALGGYLAFLSKASTAAFLGILVVVWASIAKRFNAKGLIGAFVTALASILLTSLFVDGSFFGFFQSFFEAAKMEGLSGAHSVLQFINFDFKFFATSFTLDFLTAVLIMLISGFFMCYFQEHHRIMGALFLLYPIILILFIVNYEKLFWYNYIAGYLIWMPVIGYLLCALFTHRTLSLRKNYQLLIFFLALPLGYGLNSNNSFFLTTSLSAFFSLLGLIVLLSGLSEPQRFAGRLIAMCAFCLTIVIGILVTSLGNPYRQPAILWSYNTKGSVRVGDKPLTLSPLTATYLLNLHTLAKQNNLTGNTPIIDLSPKNPGAVYAVGGYTPKVPSLHSGYQGTQKFAFFTLNKLTCDEIADSWLIFENKTLIEPIDPLLLSAFGAKFPDDYVYSGTVIKHGYFFHFSSRSTELVFYRPMRPKEVAVSECVRSKTALKLME